MPFRLAPTLNPDLPQLAWLAEVDRAAGLVRVVHGA